jgi:MFS superfamily sulfate permease-like transporter
MASALRLRSRLCGSCGVRGVRGRVDQMKGYRDVARNPEGRCIPGLVMPRWDATFFFANTEIFRERMLQAVREAATKTS